MATSNSTLWTPDGNVPLHSGQRQVDAASEAEMRAIANVHGPCQRLGIMLVCLRCDKPLQGQNDGRGRQASIWCKCREIRADFGNRIVGATL